MRNPSFEKRVHLCRGYVPSQFTLEIDSGNKKCPYKFKNEVCNIYLNGRASVNWNILSRNKNDGITMLDTQDLQYGVRHQSEFYFSNDQFCRVDDPLSLLTTFTVVEDKAPSYDPQEGDIVTFQNLWGQYFSYLSTRPSLVSKAIPEAKFTVKLDPNGGGLKFACEYSTVTMCGEKSTDDVFKVYDNEAEPGYKNLLCVTSNKFLGAAPVGKVMVWDNTQFYSCLWKITKLQ